MKSTFVLSLYSNYEEDRRKREKAEKQSAELSRQRHQRNASVEQRRQQAAQVLGRNRRK